MPWVKKTIIFLSIIIAILFFSACDAFIGSGYFSVIVKDSFSQDPIAGVLVEIADQELYTNEKGIIENLIIKSGVYTVLLSKEGYSTVERQVKINRNQDYILEIELIWLDGTSFVTGYISDTRGGPPLKGVKISGVGAQTTYTDDSGYFSVPVLKDYITDLIAEKEGFGSLRLQDVQSLADQIPYEAPMRGMFNPHWPQTPQQIEIVGIKENQVVDGEIEIEVEVNGQVDPLITYIYLDGVQRSPAVGQMQGVANGVFTIDLSDHPNGPAFLRILSYDLNRNVALLRFPIIVDNQITDSDEVGEIPHLRTFSVTFGVNVGFYRDQNFKKHGVSSLTMTTINGDEIALNELDSASSIFARLIWERADNAKGYSVYRSLDNEHFQWIGNVRGTQFDDFSSLLSVDEYMYYKVIPYNQLGEGPSIKGSVKPIAPYNVLLTKPEHQGVDISLSPTFKWEIVVEGEHPENIRYRHSLRLFEATDFIEWEQRDITTTAIEFPHTLKKGTTYTWDIFTSQAQVQYYDEENRDAYAIAAAGDDRAYGALNGEFMFTTGNGE